MYDFYNYGYNNVGDIIGDIAGATGLALGAIWGIIIGIFVFEILVYILKCFVLKLTGEKLGAKDEWKPFVPFAREHYRVKILDEPAWKMLFFADFLVLFIALFVVLNVFSRSGVFTVILLVLLLGYVGFSIYINITYYIKFYEKFGYHKILSFMRYFGALSGATEIIDILIGVDSRVQPGGRARVESVESAAAEKPVVKANLTILSGQYKGQKFDISDGSEVVLGKSADSCNIIFDQYQVHVSRKHCSISFSKETNSFTVTNYSKNGVIYNNNLKIGPNETRVLPRGTVIGLGTNDNQILMN